VHVPVVIITTQDSPAMRTECDMLRFVAQENSVASRRS
jgi:hypothetical protein